MYQGAFNQMLKTITSISTLLLVAGCAQTPQHWNRGHGEEYKFYPYTPGSSHKIAEEGRACWLEANRENWDQCS